MQNKTIIILLGLALLLSACSAVKPKESAINDGLKTSPCACDELDYDGRGFKWIG